MENIVSGVKKLRGAWDEVDIGDVVVVEDDDEEEDDENEREEFVDPVFEEEGVGRLVAEPIVIRRRYYHENKDYRSNNVV